MNKIITFSLTFVLICLVGCTPYKKLDVNKDTGKFETSFEFDKEGIDKRSLFAGVAGVDAVYVRTFDYFANEAFERYMRKGLGEIGFKTVFNREELSQMVINSNLSQYVSNVDDVINLHKISKLTKPFLIIEVIHQPIGGAWFWNEVAIRDASSGELLLHAKEKRIVWMEATQELGAPTLNLIKEWYDASMAISKSSAGVKGAEESVQVY